MALAASGRLEIRATGSKLNGAYYNSENVQVGKVDYSVASDSPILSLTDLVGVGTTTVTSAAAGFLSSFAGNGLRLASGTGSPTTGYYEIVSVTNATTVVLDRSPGTFTAGVGRVGGASLISDGAIPAIGDFNNWVPGMKAWVRAGAYPLSVNTPALSTSTVLNPSVIEGYNTVRGDCTLDPTLQRPVFSWGLSTISLMNLSANGAICRSIEFNNASNTLAIATLITASNCVFENCVITGNTGGDAFSCAGSKNVVRGNTIKAGSGSSQGLALIGTGGHLVEFNHIRSLATTVNSNSGIAMDGGGTNCIRNNIIEKFTNGIECGSGTLSGLIVEQNILHRNTNGLNADNVVQGVAALLSVRSNIFSRNTNAIRYSVSDISLNTGVIDWMAGAADCNFFYANTSNYVNLASGSNNTTLTADPFTAEATFDFTLNNVAGGGAVVRNTPCAIVFSDGINSASIIGGIVGSAISSVALDAAAMRSLWREYTNEPNTTTISDDVVDVYIQGGLEELNRRWMYHYTTDTTSVVLVAGTQEYALPTDCIEVKFVQYAGREIQKTSIEQLRNREKDWRNQLGQPQEWAHYANKLVFIPTPNAEAVVAAASPVIRYVSTPPSVTTSGPDQLPTDAYRLAVLWGVWQWSGMFPDSAVAASRGQTALQAFEQGVAAGLAAYQARGLMR